MQKHIETPFGRLELHGVIRGAWPLCKQKEGGIVRPMSKPATEEQMALAVEILGDEKEARYMLIGTGLRHDSTLKLLDRILAAESPKCDCGKTMSVRKVCKICDNDE